MQNATDGSGELRSNSLTLSIERKSQYDPVDGAEQLSSGSTGPWSPRSVSDPTDDHYQKAENNALSLPPPQRKKSPAVAPTSWGVSGVCHWVAGIFGEDTAKLFEGQFGQAQIKLNFDMCSQDQGVEGEGLLLMADPVHRQFMADWH